MAFTLRDYQENDIKRLRESLNKNNSVIYNLPTGGGKTALTSYMLQSLAKQGKRGWFICHRKELLEQASAAFNKQGIQHGLIGGRNKFNPEEKIQVCSVLSLLNKIDQLPYPDFVIWDECHHVAASSWHKIHEKVKDAKHLGLSATPIRLDGKGLDVYFNDIVRGLSMKELIAQGYLSKYKIYAPSIPDLTRLGKIKGDLSDKQLDVIVNSSFIFGDVMKHWNNYAKNKRTLIFCSTIPHSKKVANDFCKMGIKAAHLDSNCPDLERTRIISDFESGELQVLTNVDLISEGFDLPAIECIVLLRPTMSLGLYLQQVGRALRVMPGKEAAIILDHSGNSIRHGLPDAERYWNLKGRVIIQNESTMRGRICESCKAVISYTRKICECGYEIKVITQEITYLDGELIEIANTELARNGAITEQNAIDIIDLYFNHGWEAIDIQYKLFNSQNADKRVKKNWGCIISDIIHNKTWKHIARPEITATELNIRQTKYRFDKMYKINPANECWEWTGYNNNYPNIKYKNKSTKATTFIWEYYHGKRANGFVIHHKCKNKICVNSSHLELISQAEKTLRSKKPSKEDMTKRGIKGVYKINSCPILQKKRAEGSKISAMRRRKKITLWKDGMEPITFDSMTKACEFLGTGSGNLSSALKREQSICMGYYWKLESPF